MKNLKTGVLAASIAAALAIPVAVQANPHDHSKHLMVQPADLKWVDVPSLPAGAKITVVQGPMNEAVPFTARIKLPANYNLPAHWHPAIEHVTVISGTFNMGTGEKLDRSQTTALAPGAMAIMQVGTRHFAWTKEETVVQIHGTGPWGINYVNAEDDPRKKM